MSWASVKPRPRQRGADAYSRYAGRGSVSPSGGPRRARPSPHRCGFVAQSVASRRRLCRAFPRPAARCRGPFGCPGPGPASPFSARPAAAGCPVGARRSAPVSGRVPAGLARPAFAAPVSARLRAPCSVALARLRPGPAPSRPARARRLVGCGPRCAAGAACGASRLRRPWGVACAARPPTRARLPSRPLRRLGAAAGCGPGAARALPRRGPRPGAAPGGPAGPPLFWRRAAPRAEIESASGLSAPAAQGRRGARSRGHLLFRGSGLESSHFSPNRTLSKAFTPQKFG